MVEEPTDWVITVALSDYTPHKAKAALEWIDNVTANWDSAVVALDPARPLKESP